MLRVSMFVAGAAALVSAAAVAQPADELETAPAEPIASEAATMSAAEVTTRSEAEQLAEQQFLAADSNADGVLDRAEFAAFAALPPPTAEAGAEGDAADAFDAIAEADGKITEDELVEVTTGSFEAADSNSDGVLDDSEQQRFAAMTISAAPMEPDRQ